MTAPLPPELTELLERIAAIYFYESDNRQKVCRAIEQVFPLIREHVMREEQAKLAEAEENAKRLALKVCAELADKMLSEIAGGENVGFAIRNLMIPKIERAMKEGK